MQGLKLQGLKKNTCCLRLLQIYLQTWIRKSCFSSRCGTSNMDPQKKYMLSSLTCSLSETYLRRGHDEIAIGEERRGPNGVAASNGSPLEVPHRTASPPSPSAPCALKNENTPRCTILHELLKSFATERFLERDMLKMNIK